MAILCPDPGIRARHEVAVARAAREALELARQPEAVPFGDPSRSPDIPAGSLGLASLGCLASEVGQSLDALLGDHGQVFCRRSGPLLDHLTIRPMVYHVSPSDRSFGTLNGAPAVAPDVRVLNYLELSGPLERSGIATATRQQRTALATTDIDIATSPWPPDPESALTNGLVREFDLAHLNLFGPASVLVVKHAVHRDVPIVLHAHVTAEDFAGSFRGSGLVARPLRRYLRWFYGQADLVLCPSVHTAHVLRSYPVSSPIESISNGVDHTSLEGFESMRDDYRDRFGLDGIVVFAVGNVFERKGLSTFCQLATRTDYEFVWFGPYDTGPQASQSVRRWTTQPPDNVTFTGWIDDKRGAFAAGDIFCFPTKAENQGIAVLEAMACGKAVVLRDIPVFDEFYTDGVDCLKCETIEEFHEAIDRLATDHDLRERLGEGARETAAEHSLDRVGTKLASVYERLVADAR